MAISSLLTRLLYELSEKNYDRTFSAYRFWIELAAAHGGIPNDKLYKDILNSTKPESLQANYTDVVAQGNKRPVWVSPFGGQSISKKLRQEGETLFSGNLIHDRIHLLFRFITDAEQDPVLSRYAIGLHDRWCRESLERFFKQSLSYKPESGDDATSRDLCKFYTQVNLIAHWVNLGYVRLEDVRDRILQSLSLTFQSYLYTHQCNSLVILLKISGATFAAYVDPSVMDHSCNLLKGDDFGDTVASKLAKVGVLSLVI